MVKPIGKYPALSIAIGFVESGNMVYHAHTPHLTPDSLQHAGREAISIAQRHERG